MHHTIASQIMGLVMGGAATGVLAWVLLDALTKKRVLLKYGGRARRNKEPVGYWSMIAMMSVYIVGLSTAEIVMLHDLLVR